MENNEERFCPVLKAAGYINGKEVCNEKCALYVAWGCAGATGGCALEIIARMKALEASRGI